MGLLRALMPMKIKKCDYKIDLTNILVLERPCDLNYVKATLLRKKNTGTNLVDDHFSLDLRNRSLFHTSTNLHLPMWTYVVA